MGQVVDAARTFFDQLAAVGWTMLAIGLGMHLARLVCRGVAWRNILAAAYPSVPVRRLPVLGAYLAGVGLNSVAPARAGDVLKLVLVHGKIEGSTYSTLTPTLIVETLFDMVVAAGVLIWAFQQNVLPGLDVVRGPRLRSLDWHWPLEHPWPAFVIAVVWLTVIALLIWFWSKRVKNFKQRVAAGFAILRTPTAFLRGVVSWQALSWVFRAATVYFFLRAFHLPANAYTTALVLAVQSLSTLLPFTPGGVGTQQGLIVYVFRNERVARTRLVSFSVGMQIALTAFNVLLGLIALALMARTLRWKRIVTPAREEIERGKERGEVERTEPTG
jgi:glycosyltransferase 2 family protein